MNGIGLAPGQFAEVKRTFTLPDITTFASTTGDSNPIHTPSTPSPLVPGLLLSSTFPSLLSSLLPNCVYRSQSLKFVAPVHSGQECLCRIDVKDVKTLRVRNKDKGENQERGGERRGEEDKSGSNEGGGTGREQIMVVKFATNVWRVKDGLNVLGGVGEAVVKEGKGLSEMVQVEGSEEDVR